MAKAQPETLPFEDGAAAVELAREGVRQYVVEGHRPQLGSMREAFYTRTGVLVRLVGAGGRLRGCAGDWAGTDQLGEAIVGAAIAAASEESCGSEIQRPELDAVSVSVCVLGTPAVTTRAADELVVGRDVAIVERGTLSGWLYPELAVEQGWSAVEYLKRTCRTSGLHPDEWADDQVTVTLVAGTIFREDAPGGTVERLQPPPQSAG